MTTNHSTPSGDGNQYISAVFRLQSYCEASYIVKNATRVERRRKFGEVSCTGCTGQGNDLEMILTVQMKTRHPAVGSFGSKVSAICNIIADLGLWRPEI